MITLICIIVIAACVPVAYLVGLFYGYRVGRELGRELEDAARRARQEHRPNTFDGRMP